MILNAPKSFIMHFCLFFIVLSTHVNSQNLSPEEQKRLIEENKMLKQQLNQNSQTPPQSEKLMEALKRGEKFQKEQNQFLDELDKEE